jgi:uncharacterized protein YbbK (DUF523 family)
MKILISACLLGQNVKYDGNNNSILENHFIKKLLNLNILIPICPEVEGGLPTPRVPVEIIDNKAIDKEGNDRTKNFFYGANKTCQIALQNDVKIAIMKAKSPSCGKGKIYDGTFSKKLVDANGIAVIALEEIGIEVFSEDDLKKLEKILDI